jgi:alkaline phosphatase D
MSKIKYLDLAITILLALNFSSCKTGEKDNRSYFGNGFHNGWADQSSIVLWTRLTKTPEMNISGQKFITPSSDEVRKLNKAADPEQINKAQIPDGFKLDQMEGACPGTSGEVMLVYAPLFNSEKVVEIPWTPVNPNKNFTLQWKLNSLSAGTIYKVKMYARHNASSSISDSIKGSFKTPPAPEVRQNINFCIVTCHDYPRRDDSIRGHKIYNVMLGMLPDFFVHTGDVEYYDKADPFALTEELMRFKWDRIFALPFQRTFYNQVTTYFMKDDHDLLCNDASPGLTYGNVTYNRGMEIFDKEQFPTGDMPFKTVRWGKDLQIWIMEGRNFRSNNDMKDGPDKTIWGKEQKDWLFSTIRQSDATFKLIITPTPILGPDRTNKGDNHSNREFKTEGDEIRTFINQFDNVFICNGDRHWQYVTHYEGTNLWEFSTGPGSDSHAGGWPPDLQKPEHRFLRVKGGFLKGSVSTQENQPTLKFEHYDVDGNVVHVENFTRKL